MVHQLFATRNACDIYGPLVKWPKTPASHAGNTSSNLVRVTIFLKLNNLILDSVSYLIYSANRHTKKLVLIAVRVHLFPYRTQKLSSLALKILGGQLPGKISRRQHFASIAQSVEHAAVNRGVTGSSPV